MNKPEEILERLTEQMQNIIKEALQQQTNLHVKFKIDKQQICCIV